MASGCRLKQACDGFPLPHTMPMHANVCVSACRHISAIVEQMSVHLFLSYLCWGMRERAAAAGSPPSA